MTFYKGHARSSAVSTIRAGTHWRQSPKDVRHSGDIPATKNRPLSMKSTKLNMFNFGDNVDLNNLSNSTLSPVCTGPCIYAAACAFSGMLQTQTVCMCRMSIIRYITYLLSHKAKISATYVSLGTAV